MLRCMRCQHAFIIFSADHQQNYYLFGLRLLQLIIMIDVNQEDDDIVLRPDTLACLQEFLAEKAEREKQEYALLNCAENDKVEEVSFSAFEEDWV